MSGKVREAVDERVRWVDAVVADASKRGPVAIKDAIDNLEEGQADAILFMVLSARVHDMERVREIVREQVARDQFDVLEADGDVTLN